jgi:hypothetical protein
MFLKVVSKEDESETENESQSKSESEYGTQLGMSSEEGWPRKRDIEAFVSILFEIVVG